MNEEQVKEIVNMQIQNLLVTLGDHAKKIFEEKTNQFKQSNITPHPRYARLPTLGEKYSNIQTTTPSLNTDLLISTRAYDKLAPDLLK